MSRHHASGLLAFSLLVGCGGAASTQPSSDAEHAVIAADPNATSGGEAEPQTEPAPPAVVRSTIPVPVPQPAVPREQLSPALQAVWTQIEEQVANQRPPAPQETTIAEVQAWVDDPFREWLEARRRGLEQTRELMAQVGDQPPYERALALALWAYAFEDFGAQIAGAPVPDLIAEDEELLDIYIRSLNEATVPIGQRAVELYADCQRRLQALGDDSEWLPWRAYCVQRGQEVIEGYGLAPQAGAEDESPQPQTEPPEAEPSE